MAYGKSIVTGIVVAFVCLAARNSVEAVNLKSVITGAGKAKQNGGAFLQLSLETATAAELHSALQAEIQAVMTEELAQSVANDLAGDPDFVEGVKEAAAQALGEIMDTMKGRMGEVCTKMAAAAQDKINEIDGKLVELAEEEDAEADASGSQPSQPYQRYSSGAPRTQTIAFLQSELRQKHKGFFSKLRDMAKSGWSSAKTFVKDNVTSFWTSVKPAVTKGVRTVVGSISTKIPGLINNACDNAAGKLKKMESSVVASANRGRLQ